MTNARNSGRTSTPPTTSSADDIPALATAPAAPEAVNTTQSGNAASLVERIQKLIPSRFSTSFDTTAQYMDGDNRLYDAANYLANSESVPYVSRDLKCDLGNHKLQIELLWQQLTKYGVPIATFTQRTHEISAEGTGPGFGYELKARYGFWREAQTLRVKAATETGYAPAEEKTIALFQAINAYVAMVTGTQTTNSTE